MTNPSAVEEDACQIGIANLPNQKHRITWRRGARLNLMVVGDSGLGKTTFINTLFMGQICDTLNNEKRIRKITEKTVEMNIVKCEIEEKSFRIKLNIVDCPGFGDFVNNEKCWGSVVNYIDDQYEIFFKQNQQPNRKDVVDSRIHACLYFIPPTGHSLRWLDIEAMKEIGIRVNLIPVIAKADTLTRGDVMGFKERIRKAIDNHGIQVYSPPVESDDEETTIRNMNMMAASPFCVIGSTSAVPTPDGRVVRGRKYVWGTAEVENEDHCDFVKLRSLLIRTNLIDLIQSTEDLHYEAFRQQHGGKAPADVEKSAAKLKEDEESLRKKFTEQVKLEENRFRQWEQRLISERDRLNKDLEAEHNMVKSLEAELEQQQRGRK